MKTKYKKCQDFDLIIRLAKNDFRTIRIPIFIAKHHTIEYANGNRMWRLMKQGSSFFHAMILRDHITSISVWRISLRSYYTAFLLFISILFFALGHWSIIAFLVYLLILFLKVLKNILNSKSEKIRVKFIFERLVFQFLYDILFLIGFLFFHPHHKKVTYKKG